MAAASTTTKRPRLVRPSRQVSGAFLKVSVVNFLLVIKFSDIDFVDLGMFSSVIRIHDQRLSYVMRLD